jgi:hypothetical protein
MVLLTSFSGYPYDILIDGLIRVLPWVVTPKESEMPGLKGYSQCSSVNTLVLWTRVRVFMIFVIAKMVFSD